MNFGEEWIQSIRFSQEQSEYILSKKLKTTLKNVSSWIDNSNKMILSFQPKAVFESNEFPTKI